MAPRPNSQPDSASELLPCPFCGKPASRQIANTGTCWVCCSSCDAEGPLSHDEASAVVKWNARSPKWECMGRKQALPEPGECVCQDQYRRGRCTEPGCPYSISSTMSQCEGK